MLPPGIGVKVVDEVAAAHNENTLFSQRCEPLANVIVEARRASFVDAELHDRNVRSWIDLAEH